MAADLEIRDGDPVWLSPDVWTVPGADPLAPPGQPIAGQLCYLWARVHNRGDAPAVDAQTRFYIGNPATGIDRSTAIQIGESSVSVDSGDEADVLCLTPWPATAINQGHVCAIAEVLVQGSAPPGLAFDVPSDPRVAQRNLIVAKATSTVIYEFEVHNPSRRRNETHIEASVARRGSDELEKMRPTLGAELADLRLGNVKSLGLLAHPVSRCPDKAELKEAKKAQTIVLGPKERSQVALVADVERNAALVHITQRLEDGTREEAVGGLSVLIIPAER